MWGLKRNRAGEFSLPALLLISMVPLDTHQINTKYVPVTYHKRDY